MTRKEAIVFLKNANAQSELALKELLKIEDKAKRIGKIGEYYANFENCVKEIEACNIAISALEELEKSQTKIGGWIPCSERFPETSEYMEFEPTPHMKRIEISYTTDTVEYLIGFYDGSKWMDKHHNIIKNVIAWKPFLKLPGAYHG